MVRHAEVLLVRRRRLAGSLVEELTLRNAHDESVSVDVDLELGADFAHVFDVKAGVRADTVAAQPGADARDLDAPFPARPGRLDRGAPGPRPGRDRHPRGRRTMAADRGRSGGGTRESDGAAGLGRRTRRPGADVRACREPCRSASSPAGGLRCPAPYRSMPRIPPALEQAVADLAALRIVDQAHPERAVVAAGAPWFMTLFGRDSLLTAWMTLPFDGSLAAGVLGTLADLQGTRDDPGSEEQPGRILHELRRHGGGGPVLVPEPLLRHGRRDAALRRAHRRGMAMAGHRRRGTTATGRPGGPRAGLDGGAWRLER